MKIAVVSGKGGSGKSSVSAALLALAGEGTVAVDCDVDASNLPLLMEYETVAHERFVSGHIVQVDSRSCLGCGRCKEVCRFGAVRDADSGTVKIDGFLCEDCMLCVRLCPVEAIKIQPDDSSRIYTSRCRNGYLIHGDLYPGHDNSGKMIARLREIADGLTPGDGLQILDGPPGIGCPVMSTVTGVDRVVVVAEPTLSGISDLKRAVSVCREFCNDLMVIINKCDMDEANSVGIRQWCDGEGIPVVAELPFEKVFISAQIARKSIVEYDSGCRSSEILRSVAERIFDRHVISICRNY